MNTNDNSDELKNLWRSSADTPDYGAMSSTAAQTAEKIALKTKISSVVEIIVTLAIVLFFLMRAFQTENWVHISAYAGTSIGLIILEVLIIKWRRGLWHSPDLSITENAKFHLNHARFKYRMAMLALWGGPMGLAVGFSIGIIEPLSSMMSVTKIAVLAFCIGASVIYGLIKKRQAAQLLLQARATYDEITSRE